MLNAILYRVDYFMHFQERIMHGGKDFSLLAFVLGLFSSPGVLFAFVRGWKVSSLMFDLIGVLVKYS